MVETIINKENPGAAEARRLIEKLDEYLVGLYPAASNHLLPIEVLQQPDVTFLVARVEGWAVGCGAFVNRGDYAELKRMFVESEYRGSGIGQRIVAELERRALACGLTVSRIETGIYQPEALRLYERAGYHRRGPFGEYWDDPLSVFMEKKLEKKDLRSPGF